MALTTKKLQDETALVICKTCGDSKQDVHFDARIRLSRPAKPPFSDYCADCYLDQLCDNKHAHDYLAKIKEGLNGNELLLGIVEGWEEEMIWIS